jgi:hypothetical protein
VWEERKEWWSCANGVVVAKKWQCQQWNMEDVECEKWQEQKQPSRAMRGVERKESVVHTEYLPNTDEEKIYLSAVAYVGAGDACTDQS